MRLRAAVFSLPRLDGGVHRAFNLAI